MNPAIGKKLAMILALVGAALLAWAGVAWVNGSKHVGRWKTTLAEQEVELKSMRSELHTLSLQYQAYMKSLPSVPDSVKTASRTEMRATETRYEHNIRRLEFAERDLGLDISRSKRKLTQAKQARQKSALPIAGAGTAAWLCAAIVAGVSRKSPKAA